MKLRVPAAPAVKDPVLAGFVTDVTTFLRQLTEQFPFLSGHAVEDVVTVVGTTRVAHGLGRLPLGYWVTNRAGQVDTWHAQAPDKNYIYLGADAATTIDLWVF